MTQLILASSSPYRRELLQRLGLPFHAEAPDIDEGPLEGEAPEAMVRRLARAKAAALAQRYGAALIIGSDQCAVLEGTMLGKPGGFEAARAQLRLASGRCVMFHTGLCLLDSSTGKDHTEDILFKVHFRELNDARISAYLCRERPYHCAGSFRSEGLGIALFRRLEGDDPTALVGLPLIRLVAMLARAGVEVLA
jgi:septum formation protein